MKTPRLPAILTALFLVSASAPLQAQWSQNSGVGPYNYSDPANWTGGLINNVFTTAPANGLTLQFTSDFFLTNGVSLFYLGSNSVIFESDSATPRTLHLSSGNFLRTNNSGGTITIGTTNNPLIIDLSNSTRTLGGGAAGSTSSSLIVSMNINAQIVDPSATTNNGVILGGGNIYANLLNTNNSFTGPVTFNSLRGGSFANIKPIGGGPSALGAPVDSTNGTITAADGSSSGTIKYLGSGDTSDRPFVWNVTAYHTNMSWTGDFQFVNSGTGLLKLTGPWTFPTTRTNNSEFIVNASAAPIELDGYINGRGNTNGTFTYLCFLGGPATVATNRITLAGPTNDFKDFLISNVVVAYNSIAPAGTPCSIGAGTNVLVGGGTAAFGGWTGNTGQGSSLQYVGTTNATFTRNIIFTGPSYYWALDNGGSNTILTWSNTISWNGPGANVTSPNPHYFYINPQGSSTNIVYSYIPDAGLVYSGTPSGPIGVTLGIGNPAGTPLVSGGVVEMLNPTNTFSGGVQIGYGRTLEAVSLSDIGQPSSIGTGQYGSYESVNGASMHLSGINLGTPDSSRSGILSYIGTTNVSCNQHVNIFGLTFGTTNLESCTLRNDSPNGSSLHFTDTTAWTMQPQGSNSSNPFEAILGGTAATTNTLDAVLGDVPNPLGIVPGTGSLLVSGSAWRITAAQSYTGSTAATGGTLVLDGSIPAGLGCTVGSAGVLTGTGTVNENVNVLTNGTISAGDGGIGTLTINGNLTNNGTLLMKISKISGISNDLLALGANSLTYGGKLVVTNLGGTLALNDTFTLFAAGSYSGTVVSSNLPPLNSGLAWDLSSLPINGSIKVVTGTASTPPSIASVSVSGSSLVLSGSNGIANGTFYVLTTTNMATPMTNWTYLATNHFDSLGNFDVTNSVAPVVPARFFRIKLP